MAEPEIEVIDLTELTESSEDENGSDSGGSSAYGTRSLSGEESVVEIPIDDVSRAQLHAAISTVSEVRLRQVLAGLINTTPAVEEALMREFVTVKRKTRDVVPRWETCLNCDEEYDVDEERTETECVFHPGKLGLAFSCCYMKLICSQGNLRSTRKVLSTGTKTYMVQQTRPRIGESILQTSGGRVVKKMAGVMVVLKMNTRRQFPENDADFERRKVLPNHPWISPINRSTQNG